MSPWFWLIVVPVALVGALWLAFLVAVIWAAETPRPDRDNFRH